MEMDIAIVEISLCFIAMLIMLELSFKKAIEKKIPDDSSVAQSTNDESGVKIFQTSGKHMNTSFLYGVYITIFLTIGILLMFSFVVFDEAISVKDIWPFLMITGILLFSSLLIITKTKTKSKRTAQRDMREI